MLAVKVLLLIAASARLTAAEAVAPLHPDVLMGDDECQLEDGSAACALNAIQLRGQKKGAAGALPAAQEEALTEAEEAAKAADAAAKVASEASKAAEQALEIAARLGDKQMAEADGDEVSATGSQAAAKEAEAPVIDPNVIVRTDFVAPANSDLTEAEEAARAADIAAETADAAQESADVAMAIAEQLGDAQEAKEEEDAAAAAHNELSERNDTFADMSTGMDVAGPYEEEPTPEQDANPQPAKENWQGNTSLDADLGVASSWGSSFCSSHHVGTFCSGTTSVRCCKNTWGFVKCGSTYHSSSCGYHPTPYGGYGGYHSSSSYHSSTYGGYGGGYGGGYHIHPGWHQSSFCRSHHVGFFCYSHRKIHCCNDYGHYVECTTSSERSSCWR